MCLKLHPLNQKGISMIESMVALLVLAFGILGLAGVQTRILIDTRTANHRAVAIGLIQDLSERMLMHRNQAWNGNYDLSWGSCKPTACTSTDAATQDRNQWLSLVRNSLPAGDARIFRTGTDTRQIAIMVAWSENENTAAPLNATNPLYVADCPAQSICHVVYVQP